MRKSVINGGKPLKGEVAISGAKNSVVALIPAAILSDDIVILNAIYENHHLCDEDKEEALPLIRRFYNLGFNIQATSGTAEFLKEKEAQQ